MASFTHTFNKTTPVGTDLASQLDDFIRDDTKYAIAERYALEHRALDASGAGQDDDSADDAQGRHIPGLVSCVKHDTTSNISALGSKTGAIAYDTDKNLLVTYNGSSWVEGYSGSGFVRTGIQATSDLTTSYAKLTQWNKDFTLTRTSTVLYIFHGHFSNTISTISHYAKIYRDDSAISHEEQVNVRDNASTEKFVIVFTESLAAGTYQAQIWGKANAFATLRGNLDVIYF